MIFCGYGGVNSSPTGQATYRQVSSDEARKLMEMESGYIIVYVRTQREYDEEHIPHAICIPSETINNSHHFSSIGNRKFSSTAEAGGAAKSLLRNSLIWAIKL